MLGGGAAAWGLLSCHSWCGTTAAGMFRASLFLMWHTQVRAVIPQWGLGGRREPLPVSHIRLGLSLSNRQLEAVLLLLGRKPLWLVAGGRGNCSGCCSVEYFCWAERREVGRVLSSNATDSFLSNLHRFSWIGIFLSFAVYLWGPFPETLNSCCFNNFHQLYMTKLCVD